MDSYKSLDKSSFVNTSGASRKVWLIKVPKYLSKRLESAQPMQEIGRIIFIRDSAEEPNIVFNLSQDLMKPKEDNDSNDKENETKDKENISNLPIEHKFSISSVEQTIGIFSENGNSKQISFEGNVVQKGECRPIVSTTYINLNKERVKNATQTTRSVKQLERSVTVFKPIANRQTLLAKKRTSPALKYKQDKQTVRNMLFQAFEKHQYYKMKDLVRLTLQPEYYLKEIMRQLCNYNIKNPHKYMWELKPEFRHYSENKENI